MRYEVELTDEDAEWTQRLTVGDLYPTNTPKRRVLDAVFEAVRANPPKPPRLAEPGWGEKVIAHTDTYPHRRPFLRWAGDEVLAARRWNDGYTSVHWDDLIDPELMDGAS